MIDAAQRKAMPVGTRLLARYKGVEHTAEVMDGVDDKPRYVLADGRVFKSPSAAGKAITGQSVNGWTFWSVGPA